eukprot:TRINITY_DN1019_c0_g2_i1.p2 TRINITY_DN1019_c0_g2~~TRINITY_DN1019_c0_g2_i1.p2  ORF type:complete len:211 (+),score=55.26 TRINITY_DN1019_c0_g2_i1:72-704(+)
MGCRMLFLLVALLLQDVAGWTQGDYVPLLVTTSFQGQVTAPHDLPPSLTPQFGHNKAVRLGSLSTIDVGKDFDYKVSFELGHGLGRKTPWITVMTGCDTGNTANPCHVLTHLTMTMVYEQGNYGKIVGFDVETSYWIGPPGPPPQHHSHHIDNVVLKYVWIQEEHKDIHTALLAVYSASVIGSIVLLSFMFINTDSVRRGEMLVKDARKM